jgi:ubiquinone/menaquinone biosynthesis C-methylase UbiE
MTKVVDILHKNIVFDRRTVRLSTHIRSLMQPGKAVLDVGCGDGTISSMIAADGSVTVRGIDVLLRETTKIPVSLFDGKKIPFEDGSFDYVLFIDVLHHTDNIQELLSEALRVAKIGVIIKDHFCNNKLDYLFLKFMDDVGNKRFNVSLPYNYLSETRRLPKQVQQ